MNSIQRLRLSDLEKRVDLLERVLMKVKRRAEIILPPRQPCGFTENEWNNPPTTRRN